MEEICNLNRAIHVSSCSWQIDQNRATWPGEDVELPSQPRLALFLTARIHSVKIESLPYFNPEKLIKIVYDAIRNN